MKQAFLRKLKEEEESQEEKETLQFKQSRSAKPLGHRKVLTPFSVCFYNNLMLIKLLLLFFLFFFLSKTCSAILAPLPYTRKIMTKSERV